MDVKRLKCAFPAIRSAVVAHELLIRKRRSCLGSIWLLKSHFVSDRFQTRLTIY